MKKFSKVKNCDFGKGSDRSPLALLLQFLGPCPLGLRVKPKSYTKYECIIRPTTHLNIKSFIGFGTVKHRLHCWSCCPYLNSFGYKMRKHICNISYISCRNFLFSNLFIQRGTMSLNETFQYNDKINSNLVLNQIVFVLLDSRKLCL